MKTFYLLIVLALLSGINAEDISLAMQGRDLMAQGKYKEAIELFKKCIETGDLEDGTKAITYRNIGISLKNDGRPREALVYYSKSLQLFPRDLFYDLVNRGNAYSEMGEFDMAYADYAVAEMIVPDYGEIYYNRGIALEKEDKIDLAINQFKLAYAKGLRTALLEERRTYYKLNVAQALPAGGKGAYTFAGGFYDFEFIFEGTRQVELACTVAVDESGSVTLTAGKRNPLHGKITGQDVKMEINTDANQMVLAGVLEGNNYLKGTLTYFMEQNKVNGTFRLYPSGNDPEPPLKNGNKEVAP